MSQTDAHRASRIAKITRAILSLVLVCALPCSSFDPKHAIFAYAADDSSPVFTIEDVSIWCEETSEYIAYASRPEGGSIEITARGGQLNLHPTVWWSDGSSLEDAYDYITWKSSDETIATVTTAGQVTAKGDGQADITATVSGERTSSGEDLIATVHLNVVGQDSRYVSALRITDETGTEIGTEAYILDMDLSLAAAQFYANVDVYDPEQDTSETYWTGAGKLSEQTDDIADVTWYVSDDSLAAIDEATGQFRPSTYGIVQVFVKSTAGIGNTDIRTNITVTSRNSAEDNSTPDGYFPQETLTVKAYYELYTPEEYGDDAYVITKEYSVEDLEALTPVLVTYTALAGAGNYYTLTGYGVYLAAILNDAGIPELEAIKTFAFGTQDKLDRPVSYTFVFDTNRYYYPNIDIGSYAEKEQVAPMIALKSNQIKNGSTEKASEDELNEGARFRLLFGAKADGSNNAQYSIKWINTLYVILDGAPPVQPDEPDDTDPPDNPDDPDTPDTPDDPDPPDDPDEPDTPDTPDNPDDTNPSSQPDEPGGPDAPDTPKDPDESGAPTPLPGNPASGPGNENPNGNSGDLDNNPGADGGKGKGSSGRPNTSGGGYSADMPNRGTEEAPAAPQASDFRNPSTQDSSKEADVTDITEASSDSAEPYSFGAQTDSGSSSGYNIYQIMNKYSVDADSLPEGNNPLKPYVVPIGVTMFILGGVQSLLWYLWQARRVMPVPG